MRIIANPAIAAPDAAKGKVQPAHASTILFAGELGGGLGHMLQMLPVAEELSRRGHRVFMALPDAYANAAALGPANVFVLAAPHKRPHGVLGRPTWNFAEILDYCGWGDVESLRFLACEWRNLLVGFRPDLLVSDYSPTALLASCGLPMRRALIGSGFCCPPDTFPLPALLRSADPQGLADLERAVMGRANKVLSAWRQPALKRLGQLYSQVDENFLTTLPELEQYPGRTGARYWGPVLGATGGKAPDWPAGEGPRVFAYLKRFDGLADVLKAISGKGCPTVVYVDGLDAKTREQLASPTVRLEPRRVDLGRAAKECDLAVLHAGQGSTAQVLLAGKPILQLPLVLEQELTARAVVRLGAGEAAPPRNAEAVREKLEMMLASDRYAAAARAFAAKYADFDPEAQVRRMAGRVEELFADAPRAAAPTQAAHHGHPAVPAGVFCS